MPPRHTPSLRSMAVLSGARLTNARKARANEWWRQRDLSQPLPPGQYRFKKFQAQLKRQENDLASNACASLTKSA